jgi:hypothetical protein
MTTKRTVVFESFVIVGSFDFDRTQLFIPNAIMLNNRVEPPILSVKVEQVKDELQKLALNVKVKQVEQGNGYVESIINNKKINPSSNCESKASGIRTCGFM